MNKLNKKVCGVRITDKHTGKMEGMQSISTSNLTNPMCIRNKEVKGSICQKCYANTMLQMYSSLHNKCEDNTKLLTTRILDNSELPIINCAIFRFEAFGDIHNKIHLENYVNIAKKNPYCRFSLWTKNYEVALEFFKENECADNFTLILSSLFINVKYDLTAFKATGRFKKGQLKVFTVYSMDYISEHYNELDLNCGSRFCMGCQKCYAKNEIEEINEILKSDQSQVEEYEDIVSGRFEARVEGHCSVLTELMEVDSETGEEV